MLSMLWWCSQRLKCAQEQPQMLVVAGGLHDNTWLHAGNK